MYLVIEIWPDAETASTVVDPETGLNLVFANQASAQMGAMGYKMVK